jgi:hypothetical protein
MKFAREHLFFLVYAPAWAIFTVLVHACVQAR